MQLVETVPVNLKQLYKVALGLAIFTIVYNLAEGIISTYFGFDDESLTLFGFGVDSFIEVVSGFGIAHMVLRVQKQPFSNRDDFERTALKVTGYSFYALVIGLVATSIYNFWSGHKPTTTVWGIIVSTISIAIMWLLIYGKIKVGKQLSSDAILADAECTKVCIYMSVVLLVASIVYELTNIPYVDSLGTLFLAWFSFKEGQECFEKAKSNKNCCSHCD